MGQLRNKCVAEWPGVESGIRNWTEWVLDENHWYMSGGQALLCGNVSGARYVNIFIIITIFILVFWNVV